MAIVYGASAEEWAHLERVIGAADLLPVVSNPSAVISARSSMKDLGKTPSLYNREREVVGIKDWTIKRSTDEQIGRWSQDGDLGICIQTRSVRAIDIDVTDVFVADDIEAYVVETVGALPVRRRSNSAKCLMLLKLEGEWGKRRVEVAGGLVEVLMNGQQCVAVGTHPSGVRYEWDGGLPDDVPVVSEEAFEKLWSGLVEKFSTGASAGIVEYKERSRGLTVVKDDPVADYLRASGLVLSVGSLGELRIECPWKHEHSDGGVGGAAAAGTSTIWMVNGSNGHDAGHFKCLHAHCSGRTDDEFIEKIGAGAVVDQVIVDMFPVVVSAGGAGSDEDKRSQLVFKRNEKSGEILPEFSNIVTALGCSAFTGVDIGFDQFRDEVMMSLEGRGEWVSFADHHYTELWLGLVKRGFKELDYAKLKLAVFHVAMKNPFDSAIEWLSSLVWDGKPRVETFMIDYMGCEDGAYERSVGRYTWTALAGRVMSPGIKADMAPIYIGKQGAGKSTAVAAISPASEFFGDMSLSDKDAEISRRIRGKLVMELPELKGLKGMNMEHIKAMLTRTEEETRKLYREYYSKFARRCVFFGTTNEDEFLSDDSGHRRWLPLEVGMAKDVDVGAIELDRAQLWAEGREMFMTGGIEYAVAEKLGRDVHAQYVLTDPWEELLKGWLRDPHPLDGHVPERDGVVVNDFLKDKLGIDDKNISRREQMRVASILKRLGFQNVSLRVDHKVVKRWVK